MNANDLQTRTADARKLWAAGDRAHAKGQAGKGWEQYTAAHDLIVDCRALHRQAHAKLISVNRELGHWGEYLTDRVLLTFAPVGVFELLAMFFPSTVAGEALCRRTSAAG